jgi:hypothetical protein
LPETGGCRVHSAASGQQEGTICPANIALRCLRGNFVGVQPAPKAGGGADMRESTECAQTLKNALISPCRWQMMIVRNDLVLLLNNLMCSETTSNISKKPTA